MPKHTCPRRVESGMDDPGSPFRHAGRDLDTWRSLRPLGGAVRVPDGLRSCDYCGSLHPDDFMAAILRGDIIGPTDKSYKAYVGVPYAVDETRRADEVMPGLADVKEVHAHDYAKFYFQHLSEDQMRVFIDHLNNRTMTIGYPGRFYAKPFFIA